MDSRSSSRLGPWNRGIRSDRFATLSPSRAQVRHEVKGWAVELGHELPEILFDATEHVLAHPICRYSEAPGSQHPADDRVPGRHVLFEEHGHSGSFEIQDHP